MSLVRGCPLFFSDEPVARLYGALALEAFIANRLMDEQSSGN